MNYFLFSHPVRNVTRVFLLLAMLFLNFGYGGTSVAYAAPPVHDDFDSAKMIDAIEYHDTVNTTEATPIVATVGTTDDPSGFQCQGGQVPSYPPGFASVWYRYTPSEMQSISLDTIDTDYDTYIAVWTGNRGALNLVACNDETFEGSGSELSFIGTTGTTYHIQVAQYNDNTGGTDHIGGILNFNAYITNTDVKVGGVLRGRYFIPVGGDLRRSFLNLNNGPVEITNVAGNQSLAAARVIYTVNNVPTSFTEMMGLPNNQLSNIYWFPWYNNRDLDTQLRFGNISGSQTATVRVYIGGAEMTNCTSSPAMSYPYVLDPGESVRVSCPRVNSGPVKVQSNINIVAAERLIYRVNGVATSFSEGMGLPNSQLSTIYWFPWYNNRDLDTQLRFGNVHPTLPSTVRLYIGGIERSNCTSSPAMPYPYVLDPGESVRVSCPSVNSGPVKIQSTQEIVTAERIIYRVNGVPVSFTEMMGLPNSHLSTIYWMPVYNNRFLDTQLRFGNVHPTLPATVRVYIGGIERSNCTSSPAMSYPYVLDPGESVRVSCAGVNDGPVKIESTQEIVAAERLIYTVAGKPTSFSEMMGLPNGRLDAKYWFPWYNNRDLDTQLRFALP